MEKGVRLAHSLAERNPLEMRGGLHQQNYGSRQREGSRLRMTIIGLASTRVHTYTHTYARGGWRWGVQWLDPTRPPGEFLSRSLCIPPVPPLARLPTMHQCSRCNDVVGNRVRGSLNVCCKLQAIRGEERARVLHHCRSRNRKPRDL